MELVCFRTRQRLRTKVIFVLLNTPLLLCCSHLLFFYLLSLPISLLISFSFFFLWHFPFLSFPYLLSPLSLPLPILSLRSCPITSLIPSFFFLKFFPFLSFPSPLLFPSSFFSPFLIIPFPLSSLFSLFSELSQPSPPWSLVSSYLLLFFACYFMFWTHFLKEPAKNKNKIK